MEKNLGKGGQKKETKAKLTVTDETAKQRSQSGNVCLFIEGIAPPTTQGHLVQSKKYFFKLKIKK